MLSYPMLLRYHVSYPMLLGCKVVISHVTDVSCCHILCYCGAMLSYPMLQRWNVIYHVTHIIRQMPYSWYSMSSHTWLLRLHIATIQCKMGPMLHKCNVVVYQAIKVPCYRDVGFLYAMLMMCHVTICHVTICHVTKVPCYRVPCCHIRCYRGTLLYSTISCY